MHEPTNSPIPSGLAGWEEGARGRGSPPLSGFIFLVPPGGTERGHGSCATLPEVSHHKKSAPCLSAPAPGGTDGEHKTPHTRNDLHGPAEPLVCFQTAAALRDLGRNKASDTILETLGVFTCAPSIKARLTGHELPPIRRLNDQNNPAGVATTQPARAEKHWVTRRPSEDSFCEFPKGHARKKRNPREWKSGTTRKKRKKSFAI